MDDVKMYKCPCGTEKPYMGFCKVCTRERYRKKKGIIGEPVYKIDRFRSLSDLEMRKVVDEFITLTAVAKAFGCSRSQISLEVSKRDLYSLNDVGNSTTNRFYKPELEVVHYKTEHELRSKDAWINSPERKSFVNAGLMRNKSLKYK